MENDPGQVVVTILGFFAVLTLLLMLLDRLESSLDAPAKPLHQRARQFWQLITRTRR